MPTKTNATKPRTQSGKSESLCCITIEFTHLVLPVDKGLKVMELLQGATLCEIAFNRNREYFTRDAVELEYRSIKQSELRQRRPVKAEEQP